ncbi:MAG: hypothetical protein H6599_07635 [Flavobacteriales bacterium]|nr:hypothetical protein [Flavobacteriales bacterium]
MKLSFFIWLVLISAVSFSQSSIVLKDSSETTEFERYVKRILNLPKDTSFNDSTIHSYRLVYLSSCPFSEMLFSQSNLTQTSGKSFVQRDLESNENNFDLSQTSLYLCADHPQKVVDSTVYHLKANHQQADSNDIFWSINMSEFSNYWVIYTGSSGIYLSLSFNNHQYIIMETSYILQYGNQTSWGTTETMFFERVRE